MVSYWLQEAYVSVLLLIIWLNTMSLLIYFLKQSYGIESLVVYLDSQLVVSQLNNIYRVRDPSLHHQTLRVKLLQRSFNFISFINIPRSDNAFDYYIANQALEWHINHSSH